MSLKLLCLRYLSENDEELFSLGDVSGCCGCGGGRFSGLLFGYSSKSWSPSILELANHLFDRLGLYDDIFQECKLVILVFTKTIPKMDNLEARSNSQ